MKQKVFFICVLLITRSGFCHGYYDSNDDIFMTACPIVQRLLHKEMQ